MSNFLASAKKVMQRRDNKKLLLKISNVNNSSEYGKFNLLADLPTRPFIRHHATALLYRRAISAQIVAAYLSAQARYHLDRAFRYKDRTDTVGMLIYSGALRDAREYQRLSEAQYRISRNERGLE